MIELNGNYFRLNAVKYIFLSLGPLPSLTDKAYLAHKLLIGIINRKFNEIVNYNIWIQTSDKVELMVRRKNVSETYDH